MPFQSRGQGTALTYVSTKRRMKSLSMLNEIFVPIETVSEVKNGKNAKGIENFIPAMSLSK